jgi:hypothetical protein
VTRLALLLCFIAVACGRQNDDGSTAALPEMATMDTAAPPSGQGQGQASGRVIEPGRLIRSDGIGHSRRGMTIGDLRAALPAGTSLRPAGPYMVDIDAMPVVEGRDTLYVVLIPSGDPSGDATRIELVATTDTTFRTAEGVGPGTALADAAAVYGAPTLAYNINDESREYALFPTLSPTIRMRVRPAGDTSAFAGVYTTNREYNETARYDPAARVMMVQVHMR